jgi:hypothetical protein
LAIAVAVVVEPPGPGVDTEADALGCPVRPAKKIENLSLCKTAPRFLQGSARFCKVSFCVGCHSLIAVLRVASEAANKNRCFGCFSPSVM